MPFSSSLSSPFLECSVDKQRENALPRHVAIIMDGNSRWASARGLPRVAGHRAGAQAVKRCVQAAIAYGIGWLTLYAFSSENWRRAPEEVTSLTSLLRYYLQHEIEELHREGVRFRVIGDLSRFDENLQERLLAAEALTKGNQRLTLTLALSYGGRADIVQASKRIALAVQQKEIMPQDITEEVFEKYLQTLDIPDPDLVLRTSGESRLSNFLLWQSAYAELIFLEILWPDFNEQHFDKVLEIYTRRERRFGARPGLNIDKQ